MLSSAALQDLDEIWHWNADHYGLKHAERYVKFLRAETNKIASGSFKGNPVPNAPRLNYVLIRRRRKGHGHLAVYERVSDVIHVLRYFHTAQDWQTHLLSDKP